MEIWYKDAVKKGIVTKTAMDWLSDQEPYNLLSQDLERLFVGWINGNHGLILENRHR